MPPILARANTHRPSLSAAELAELDVKAAGWLAHAVRPGGHVQWGQAMPIAVVSSRDPNTSHPLYFDDVGDTACWTGHLLAALVHKYDAAPDNATLGVINTILTAYDLGTTCTEHVGYIPRTWALPDSRNPVDALGILLPSMSPSAPTRHVSP